jgi:hypothetical protein
MLLQAPEPVLTFLTPAVSGDKIEFHLHKAIIVGQLAETTLNQKQLVREVRSA